LDFGATDGSLPSFRLDVDRVEAEVIFLDDAVEAIATRRSKKRNEAPRTDANSSVSTARLSW